MIFENIIRRFLFENLRRFIFAKTTSPKSLNKPLPLRKRRLRAYSISTNPLLLIIFSDMLRMLNINSIYNALFVKSKPLERLKQSFNTWRDIQSFLHFLHQEISIS